MATQKPAPATDEPLKAGGKVSGKWPFVQAEPEEKPAEEKPAAKEPAKSSYSSTSSYGGVGSSS